MEDKNSRNASNVQTRSRKPSYQVSSPESSATFTREIEAAPVLDDNNPDVVALRTTVHLLQQQRQHAVGDIRTLNRLRQQAWERPEEFAQQVASGRLSSEFKKPDHSPGNAKRQKSELTGLNFTDQHQRKTPNETSFHRARTGDDNIVDSFEHVPVPQQVHRMPPINWENHHILGDPLDRLHEEQRLHPSLGEPQRGPSSVDGATRTSPGHEREPVPVSESDNTDFIALRAAAGLLQKQREYAVDDLEALERVKQQAWEHPEEFARQASAGQLPFKPENFVHAKDTTKERRCDEQRHPDGVEQRQGDPSKLSHNISDAGTEHSDNALAFEPVPVPQSVIRMPAINWAKYRISDDPSSQVHGEEQPRQDLSPDMRPPHSVAAPYRPFLDSAFRIQRRSSERRFVVPVPKSTRRKS